MESPPTRRDDRLLEVEGLSKSFGAIQAVRDVSFFVSRGDVLGFLGPNGAGKTTAMKMITGFLTPDRGRVRLGGFDVQENPIPAQRLLGYLAESGAAYGEMRVDAFLRFVAEARALDRIDFAVDRAIDRTGLGEVRSQTVETLSKGFKRRVSLAQALIHDPEVLVLDEPTDGLDPNQKVLVHELIDELAADRKAIILSTHILDEAERVCNRAIVISRGEILTDSTPGDLVASMPAGEGLEAAFRSLTGGVVQ